MLLLREDLELMISLIREREALWDKVITFHCEKSHLRKLWIEVESRLNELKHSTRYGAIPLKVIQMKWYYFVSTYKKKYRNVLLGRRSKWKFLESLKFLQSTLDYDIQSDRLVYVPFFDPKRDINLAENAGDTSEDEANEETLNSENPSPKPLPTGPSSCVPANSLMFNPSSDKFMQSQMVITDEPAMNRLLDATLGPLKTKWKTSLRYKINRELQRKLKRTFRVKKKGQNTTPQTLPCTNEKVDEFGDDELFVCTLKCIYKKFGHGTQTKYRTKIINLLNGFRSQKTAEKT